MEVRKNIVVELSGRDSVVALLEFVSKANEQKALYNFIFSVAYIPSEYDEEYNNNIFALGEVLKMHVERYGHKVLNMLYSAEVGVWFKAIKPIFGEVEGICTPCIGCHAYCHLCRLDIATEYNADIITGERLSHSGNYKINQTAEVLNFMDTYFAKSNIKFIRPLKDIISNEIVEDLYNNFCDMYGFEPDRYLFPKCYLSGNIKINKDNEDKIKTYITNYLSNLESIMDSILEEYRKDAEKAAKLEQEILLEGGKE